MSVAIIYASHYGHTREICERLAEGLRLRDVNSDILDAGDLPSGFSLRGYEAAIVAGSVHYGRHPRSLTRFVRAHRDDLDTLPSAWLSVSLAAADERGASEARELASRFPERIGWQPTLTMPVAGALSYRRYGPLRRLMMRQIARMSGAATDTTRDHVYTDWDQIDALAARVGETLHGGVQWRGAERDPRPE